MGRRPNLSQVNRARLIAASGIASTCLIAFLILGSAGAIASVIFLPTILALLINLTHGNVATPAQHMLDSRGAITAQLSRNLGQIGYPTVSLLVELDGFRTLEEMHDRADLEDALSFTQSTIETHLTDADVTVNLDGACFAAAIAPHGPFDLEAMLITCTRIQHSLNGAASIGKPSFKLTASIGFATSSQIEHPTGASLLQASMTALAEARRNGPGAVRGYSRTMTKRRDAQLQIGKEAANAFDRGEIFSYFQPQIVLETGELAGFEALTRWHHPERGIIAPADFLPVLKQAGLMETLGDTMVKQALNALDYWDKSGLYVPRVGVNFSTDELNNPFLVDRIAMLLDASDIEPERLVIEVLETVIAKSADDDIICNLAALSDLGCGIDLDDFGTGYASITNIQNFSVGRIKIDRSFVAGLDSDPEQGKMVSAILTMADRLGVRALAEGVETKGERAALNALGCHDAQGFQIARPMPLEETVDWAIMQFGIANQPVRLSKRAG